jgi:hypothetical protein
MKDTFFFSHDYNARTDPKMQKVLMKHGCAGIGVYWCVIEQIYEQGGILPLSDCESIAFALRMDEKVVESIVIDFDLFKNDGVNFWSESVNQRLNKRAEIAEKRKNAAMNRWNKSSNGAKQQENNASEMQMHEDSMQGYANKEKESKGKNNKENNIESNKLDSSENDFSGVPVPEQVDDNNSEQEKEKSSGKKEKIDFDAVVALYHKCCPSFPRIIKLSDARKQKIKIRLSEMKNDWALLESVFSTMESSKFLRGDNKNGWQATFDWVFDNEKNWLKVIEGNYNDKSPAAGDSKNVNDIWDNQ